MRNKAGRDEIKRQNGSLEGKREGVHEIAIWSTDCIDSVVLKGLHIV